MPLTFYEYELSDSIRAGSRGGPRFARVLDKSIGGKVNQQFLWTRPLQSYDLSYGIKTVANFEEVRAMWYVVMGTPHLGFRVKDWNDYKLTSQTSTLTLDGSDWRAGRLYTAPGGGTFVRRLTKFKTAPLWFRNRAGTVTQLALSTDLNTGIVTMSGHADGDIYFATGEFRVPVIFTDDTFMQVEVEGRVGNILQSLPSIPLQEVPL
jgi:uncharacterized protein (TIGR02217 family)